MKKSTSFLSYLEYDFQRTYRGTDDNAPDAFYTHLSEMSTSDLLIELNNYYDEFYEEDDWVLVKEFLSKLIDK